MACISDQIFLSFNGEIDDLPWEQCLRLLMTNPISQLLTLQSYTNKILQNIITHAEEEKYLKLKFNNPTLQKNVFGVNGGLELFQSMGFKLELEPIMNEKFLISPIFSMNRLKTDTQYLNATQEDKDRIDLEYHSYLEKLSLSEEWLANTISAFLQIHQIKQQQQSAKGMKNDLAEIPADSLIQLQLPNGRVVVGGFMKTDLISDVIRLACSYFTLDRHSLVEIRLPFEASPISKSDYLKTLEEMRLSGRVKFIVTAVDAEQLSNMKLLKSPAIAVENKEVDYKRRYEEIKKRKQEKLAAEQARLKVLKAFKDDRLERKYQQPSGVSEENMKEMNIEEAETSEKIPPDS